MWSAIGALSNPHREILVLRDFHDLTYAEIAGVLDVPVGTVMSRLHAARFGRSAADRETFARRAVLKLPL